VRSWTSRRRAPLGLDSTRHRSRHDSAGSQPRSRYLCRHARRKSGERYNRASVTECDSSARDAGSVQVVCGCRSKGGGEGAGWMGGGTKSIPWMGVATLYSCLAKGALLPESTVTLRLRVTSRSCTTWPPRRREMCSWSPRGARIKAINANACDKDVPTSKPNTASPPVATHPSLLHPPGILGLS
jgi:hypothetical protein